MFLKPGQPPDHGFDEPLGLLSDCHRRIEHFLDTLVILERQTEGARLMPLQRRQLDGALTYFATAAPRHTADEEDSLFPRLRASSDPAAAEVREVLERLERDHGDADARHKAVDVLGRRWLAEGELSADDARELRQHLAVLKSLYDAHIGIEDRELFPAASRVLTADELHTVGREMADRRAVQAGKPR